MGTEKIGKMRTDLFSFTANQVQDAEHLLVARGKYPPFSSKINPSPVPFLRPLFATFCSENKSVPFYRIHFLNINLAL
jgi:hypothetical protein